MTSDYRAARILLLGDAEQIHLERWARYLSDIGHTVLTISLENGSRFAGEVRKIETPSWLPAFIRYPLSVPAVRREARLFRPDIVNAHFLPNYGMIAALLGYTPWVLSTWGSDIMLLPQRSAFHAWRTRYVIGKASHITSDADVMTRRLAELGAQADRIHTFPYGVDRSLFHRTDELRTTGGPRILSNRKLEPLYSIDTLLAAFPLVRSEAPEAELTIAGKGSMEGELKRQAEQTGEGKTIHFAGLVPHTELPARLHQHDIFVSVSLSDTTSVSLLEAMACGVFPIVSDIPANREWIQDGKNGYLVPTQDASALADAIARAWKNVDVRRDAADANEEIIRSRADWTENMRVVAELFDRLLSESGAVKPCS